MSVVNQANIVAVMGGSGSGKSTYIKQEIQRLKPKRLVIFDVMHEYAPFAKTVIHGSLVEFARALRQPSFSIAFQPTTMGRQEQFDFICKSVFKLGNCCFVIEELNTVTDAGKAPPDWQDCTSRGRHKGLTIYGASQRPAGVDKDFFSNATKVRTGRVNYKADKQTLADVLDVSVFEITQLMPLQYIERNMGTGEVEKGFLHYGKGTNPVVTNRRSKKN